jgi:hypothetical protein
MLLHKDGGGGAVREGTTTGGRWSTIEQQAHINVLELKAAFFALKSLCVNDRDVYIHLQLHNTTAVAYLNKMGGGGHNLDLSTS